MDDRITALCIKCLTVVALCVILTIGSCIVHTDRCVTQLIESGTEPLAANLALHETMATEMTIYNLTKDNK